MIAFAALSLSVGRRVSRSLATLLGVVVARDPGRGACSSRSSASGTFNRYESIAPGNVDCDQGHQDDEPRRTSRRRSPRAPFGVGLGDASGAAAGFGGKQTELLEGHGVSAETQYNFVADELGLPGLILWVAFTIRLLVLALRRLRRIADIEMRLYLAAMLVDVHRLHADGLLGADDGERGVRAVLLADAPGSPRTGSPGPRTPDGRRAATPEASGVSAAQPERWAAHRADAVRRRAATAARLLHRRASPRAARRRCTRCCARHPQIFMPERKEPWFFAERAARAHAAAARRHAADARGVPRAVRAGAARAARSARPRALYLWSRTAARRDRRGPAGGADHRDPARAGELPALAAPAVRRDLRRDRERLRARRWRSRPRGARAARSRATRTGRRRCCTPTTSATSSSCAATTSCSRPSRCSC